METCYRWTLDNRGTDVVNDDSANNKKHEDAQRDDNSCAEASTRNAPMKVTVVANGKEEDMSAKTKGSHFHVGGHQYTLCTQGKQGIDTWRCSYYRRCTGCRVNAHHTRNTGRFLLFMSKGEASDKNEHSDGCKRLNGLLKSDSMNAVIASGNIENTRTVEDLPKGGVNVSAEAMQLAKVLAIKKQRVPPGEICLVQMTCFVKQSTCRTKKHKDTHAPFLFCRLTVPNRKDNTKMDRVMGFGHPSLIKLFNGKCNMFVDATFSCTPKSFYQTLIVMMFHQDTHNYVPVC